MSDDIYRRAIERYGAEKQLRKFQEECSEAGAAVAHYLDGRGDAADHLAEEIADVLITAEQARLIVGSNTVDYIKARKLERLAKRLEGAGG